MDISREEAFSIFAQFDKDKSGTIEKKELAKLLEAFGFTANKQFVNAAMKHFDKDNSKTIDFDEFYLWITGQ